jgi:hypothetical protein
MGGTLGRSMHSVRPRSHPGDMVVRARLFCTDAGCAARFDAIGRIEELETLACPCGAGLEVVAWPEPTDDGPGGGGFELLPLAA